MHPAIPETRYLKSLFCRVVQDIDRGTGKLSDCMFVFPHPDPTAFSLGPLHVHWYGIMYLVGFVAAWWLARRRAARAAVRPGRRRTSTTSSSSVPSA